MNTSDIMVYRAVMKQDEYTVCCSVYIYPTTYLHMALSFQKKD